MRFKFVPMLVITAAATAGLGLMTLTLPARADALAGCTDSSCYLPGSGWGGCDGQTQKNCLCKIGMSPGQPDGADCGTPAPE